MSEVESERRGMAMQQLFQMLSGKRWPSDSPSPPSFSPVLPCSLILSPLTLLICVYMCTFHFWPNRWVTCRRLLMTQIVREEQRWREWVKKKLRVSLTWGCTESITGRLVKIENTYRLKRVAKKKVKEGKGTQEIDRVKRDALREGYYLINFECRPAYN